MVEIDFLKELLQMRENYKNNSLEDIKLGRPGWLDEEDPMSEIYEKKSLLLQKGEIIYAHIVQANVILYKLFPPYDCPAHILYSLDPYFMEKPYALEDIALKIYNYKGMDIELVPNEWKEIARVITDEYDRSDFTFSLDLNDKSAKYHMIPTMIYRKLLPKRKLCGNILPVLTHPESKQVLILPKKYWTKNFIKAWTEGFITKEQQKWNKMWDLWYEEKVSSPYDELMTYQDEINTGGHQLYFVNIKNAGDLQKEMSTLENILPQKLICNLHKAYEAYLVLEEKEDDEQAEEILEQCDDVFYENEEEINRLLEGYAEKIEL